MVGRHPSFLLLWEVPWLRQPDEKSVGRLGRPTRAGSRCFTGTAS